MSQLQLSSFIWAWDPNESLCVDNNVWFAEKSVQR